MFCVFPNVQFSPATCSSWKQKWNEKWHVFADIFSGNWDNCDFLYRERLWYACCQLRVLFYLIMCVRVCVCVCVTKTRGGKAACLRKGMKRKAWDTWVMGLSRTMSCIFVVLCMLFVSKSMPAECSFMHELLFGYNICVCVCVCVWERERERERERENLKTNYPQVVLSCKCLWTYLVHAMPHTVGVLLMYCWAPLVYMDDLYPIT